MTTQDQDIRLFAGQELTTEKSRRKLERLVEDLNLEISSMPIALRSPFRILRDIALEILDE